MKRTEYIITWEDGHQKICRVQREIADMTGLSIVDISKALHSGRGVYDRDGNKLWVEELFKNDR